MQKNILKIKILGSLRIVIKHENCALKKKGPQNKKTPPKQHLKWLKVLIVTVLSLNMK